MMDLTEIADALERDCRESDKVPSYVQSIRRAHTDYEQMMVEETRFWRDSSAHWRQLAYRHANEASRLRRDHKETERELEQLRQAAELVVEIIEDDGRPGERIEIGSSAWDAAVYRLHAALNADQKENSDDSIRQAGP